MNMNAGNGIENRMMVRFGIDERQPEIFQNTLYRVDFIPFLLLILNLILSIH